MIVIEVYPVLAPTQGDLQGGWFDTKTSRPQVERFYHCASPLSTLLKPQICALPCQSTENVTRPKNSHQQSNIHLFHRLWLTISCCVLFWLLVCVIAAFLYRTKQERRLRVSWLRADVFLKRKVRITCFLVFKLPFRMLTIYIPECLSSQPSLARPESWNEKTKVWQN